MTIAVPQKQSSKTFAPVLPTPSLGLNSIWHKVYPYICIGWIALLLVSSLLVVHVHHQRRQID